MKRAYLAAYMLLYVTTCWHESVYLVCVCLHLLLTLTLHLIVYSQVTELKVWICTCIYTHKKKDNYYLPLTHGIEYTLLDLTVACIWMYGVWPVWLISFECRCVCDGSAVVSFFLCVFLLVFMIAKSWVYLWWTSWVLCCMAPPFNILTCPTLGTTRTINRSIPCRRLGIPCLMILQAPFNVHRQAHHALLYIAPRGLDDLQHKYKVE